MVREGWNYERREKRERCERRAERELKSEIEEGG